LNGEPLPAFDLAPAPMDIKLVAPQLASTFEPVCPGAADAAPGLRLGLGIRLWRSSAKATPADGSSRQAPTVREANTCFISALPFKTMLRIGDSCLRTSRRAHWALTCALTIAVQAVGLDRCQQNTGRGQNIPSCPDFFEPPSAVSERLFRLQESRFCWRYLSKALRSS
jgi:hypothetical protein